MVFYKKRYRNVRSAMDHDDGLTVLAFFYEVNGLFSSEQFCLFHSVVEARSKWRSLAYLAQDRH